MAALIVAAVQVLSGNDVTNVTPPMHADLKTVALAVQRPSEVDGSVHDISDPQAPLEDTKVDAVMVDVTVKNSGGAPAVILGADFLFRFAEQLENCAPLGGEAEISAQYSVKVPTAPPPRPFDLSVSMRFEVRAGVSERFTFTLGPETQYISAPVPWLYVADIALRYDESSQPLKVGTVGVVARHGDGVSNFDNAAAPGSNRTCAQRNAQIVKNMTAIPATRAAEVEFLQEKYSLFS